MSQQKKKPKTPTRRVLARGEKPDPAAWMYAGTQTDLEVGQVVCLVRGPVKDREERLVPPGSISELAEAIQIPWELRESWGRVTR